MSAAACKILYCGGLLFQTISDAMTRTDEAAADSIIEWLEDMTERVRNL